MNRKKILFYSLLTTFFLLNMNSAFSQKVTTDEFLKQFVLDNCVEDSMDTLIHLINPKEYSINKKTKSKLTKKQPIILFEKVFPSPCNLHKFELENGIYSIELISFGNMAGFKKTIMLPLVKVMSKQLGEIKNITVDTYEVRSATSVLPFHIYTIWKFEIKKSGFYYIQVNSDNSSNSNLKLGNTIDETTVYSNITVSPVSPVVTASGIITSMLLKDYPVKRSPFGKYRIEITKQ